MNQSFYSQEQFKAKLKSISDDFFDLNSINQKNLSKFSVDERNAKRKSPEKTEGLYRNAFQIDRDRIIHTNSFRRLKHKSLSLIHI